MRKFKQPEHFDQFASAEEAQHVWSACCYADENSGDVSSLYGAHHTKVWTYLRACAYAVHISGILQSESGIVPEWDWLGSAEKEDVISYLAGIGVVAEAKDGSLHLDWRAAITSHEQSAKAQPSIVPPLIVEQIEKDVEQWPKPDDGAR